MPIDRPFPIWTATLRRPGGPSLTVPLALPAPVGVDADAEEVARRLAAALRDHWMVDGTYAPLLSARLRDVEPLELTVELPRAGALHPAQALPFVALSAPAGDGVTVWVPGPGVVAWGPDPEAAREAAVASLGAWIARYGARDDPRALAVASGWTSAEVSVVEESLPWYTLGERREISQRRGAERSPRLDRATEPLSSTPCFGLDAPRAALIRALDAGQSAVLVGPRGAGKSCLSASVAAPRYGDSLRTTTAARLEVALTTEGAWQAPLSELCAEIGRGKVHLHVASLADLFEVGRYVGNATSLGEYLRPWLARGEIHLLTECTAEEYATIDARYPGVLEHLARVDVPAPDDAALASVVHAWARHQGDIEIGAADEAIRLLRRFSPYSGFPGVTLRFLASLAREVRPVTAAAVASRFAAESGIPPAFVDPRAALSVADLEGRLTSALFGQPEASAALLDVLAAVKADVSPHGRPIASLLFTGPTGVGKTEAARALATVLFGHRDRMVRFDCSEIATPAAVQRLVGSPEPHGEGLLTGAVRRQPFSVVLLDEIEKAHPDLFDLLLQVLGEGRLTDHRGRTADFCSAIVVLTSNLGAERAQRAPIGLGARADAGLAEELRAAVYRAFRPELVNRFDRILPFRPLSREAVERVLDRELQALARDPVLKERGITLEITAETREWLAERGHDPSRGARPLQRLLRDAVVARLAVALNARGARGPARAVVAMADGQPRVDLHPLPERGGPIGAAALTSERRLLQAVLAGETVAELTTTLAVEERQARFAAERRPLRAAPDHMSRIRAARGPIAALRAALAAVSSLEGDALAALLDGTDGPPAAEVEAARARTGAACRDVYRVVHPHHDIAFVGVWSPSSGLEPVELADAWAAGWAEAAEALGFGVRREPVWALAEGFAAAAEPPRDARRWVGVELWVTGPAAARLATLACGLYEQGPVRVRVGAGLRPLSPEPGCCEGEVWPAITRDRRAWKPPRPADLLRRAAFEGEARPWPPPLPTARLLGDAILEHLA